MCAMAQQESQMKPFETKRKQTGRGRHFDFWPLFSLLKHLDIFFLDIYFLLPSRAAIYGSVAKHSIRSRKHTHTHIQRQRLLNNSIKEKRKVKNSKRKVDFILKIIQ